MSNKQQVINKRYVDWNLLTNIRFNCHWNNGLLLVRCQTIACTRLYILWEGFYFNWWLSSSIENFLGHQIPFRSFALPLYQVNTLRGRQKSDILQSKFSNAKMNENMFTFFKFHWNMLSMSQLIINHHRLSGLAPTRRQEIVWTNISIVGWRIYASLGLNGLQQNAFILHSLSVQIVVLGYFTF